MVEIKLVLLAESVGLTPSFLHKNYLPRGSSASWTKRP